MEMSSVSITVHPTLGTQRCTCLQQSVCVPLTEERLAEAEQDSRVKTCVSVLMGKSQKLRAKGEHAFELTHGGLVTASPLAKTEES